jgi:hypothetical protein
VGRRSRSRETCGAQIPVPGRSGGSIALTSRRRGALAGMMAAGASGVAVAGLSHCGHFQAKGAANRGKPCLRQQLIVLQRRHPRPRLRDADRRFWILASRRFTVSGVVSTHCKPRFELQHANHRYPLLIVRPETVLGFQRAVGGRTGGGDPLMKQEVAARQSRLSFKL